MKFNVGVDVGGTFTDVLLANTETGELTIEKVLSTPENQSIGVLEGLEKVCEKAGISFSEINLLHHGTTVVTNMILESKGSRVGLLTTKGHEHILHLARAWTPGPLYGWIGMNKPDPLADLIDTRGVDERIDANGNIVQEINYEMCRKQIHELVDQGVESIAVALLNSYVNPQHEIQIRNLIQEMYPNLPVSISSSIVPEYGEYERALTTVINTYARPRVLKYLNSLEQAQHEKGFKGELNIVRSDGGTMSAKAAAERPVDIVFSGPSGGVIGSAYLSELIDVPNVLVFDMGGTSTDVSLVYGKKAAMKRNVQLGYFEFKSRTVDVHSVGAGGGSIAHLSKAGTLLVGPQSAGADPGPACYGRGGTEPTVTDANVVLGHLPPGIKLGGNMELDVKAARDAIEPIAEQMGLSIEETAQGILDIANENMHSALRVVSVERGYDPREFGLVAFGGAGPMHANALAKLINSFPVIIPPAPGVMSAFGFLSSNIQNEFAKTYLKIAEETPVEDLIHTMKLLQEEANIWLDHENVPQDMRDFEFFVDCRYYLQNIQIPCKVDLHTLREKGIQSIRDIFEQEHRRQFGFDLKTDMEMATVRVIGKGMIKGVSLKAGEVAAGEIRIPDRVEDVYFNNEWMPTPLYNRNLLKSGHVIAGPAIVYQEDSTIVIEPGYKGQVDAYGNILIDKED